MQRTNEAQGEKIECDAPGEGWGDADASEGIPTTFELELRVFM